MFENAEAAITYLLNISEEEFFRNFTFKDNALEEYKKYLEDFKRCNNDKNVSTNEKGKSLENLVLFVAEKTNLFTVIPNVKNASNEIDLLLCPKIQSRVFCKTFLHNIAKKKYTPLRLKFFSDYCGFDRAFLSR